VHIEGVFKRGAFAFALVDAKEALGRAKRDASMGLLSTSTQKAKGARSNQFRRNCRSRTVVGVASGHQAT
jgi:hypothetical protein